MEKVASSLTPYMFNSVQSNKALLIKLMSLCFQVPGSNAAATSKMSRAMGTSVENEQMFLASNTIHKKVLPSLTLKFK